MIGCGFCEKAKKILKNEIKNGNIEIKDSSEAKGVSGFPHFLNTSNGLTHTGCPSNISDLYSKLNYHPKNIERFSLCQKKRLGNDKLWIGVL